MSFRHISMRYRSINYTLYFIYEIYQTFSFNYRFVYHRLIIIGKTISHLLPMFQKMFSFFFSFLFFFNSLLCYCLYNRNSGPTVITSIPHNWIESVKDEDYKNCLETVQRYPNFFYLFFIFFIPAFSSFTIL